MPRNLRTVSHLSLLVLTALLFLLPEMARAQWSQYQGNAAHTGYVAETVQSNVFSKAWEADYMCDGKPALQGSLAVSSKGVFAVAYAGGSYTYPKYNVFSLNTATGAEQWKRQITTYIGAVSAPSLGEDRVYVHKYGSSIVYGGNSWQYPYLMGMDADTGEVKFTTTHAGQTDSGSRPTVLGNQVVSLGGAYGGMNAYDASTGASQWFTGLPQQYYSIPAMDEQRVYIYYGDGEFSPGPQVSTFYAIDRQTGSIQYTIQNPTDFSTTYSSISSVVLGGQNDALVICGTTSSSVKQITSFNLAQQGIKWSRGLNAVNALAVTGGVIAVPLQTSLVMIDEATGSDLWAWLAPANTSLVSNVVMTQNLIFVASKDTLFAIDRTSQQTVWSELIGTDTPSYSPNYNLAYCNGTLYASGWSRVLAFSSVPEPSSVFVLLGGISALFAYKRRKA